MHAAFELPYASREPLLPPGLHPTTPPLMVLLAWRVADSPWGPFSMAQARISCRSGVRPRGFVAGCIVDDAAGRRRLLPPDWGAARRGSARSRCNAATTGPSSSSPAMGRPPSIWSAPTPTRSARGRAVQRHHHAGTHAARPQAGPGRARLRAAPRRADPSPSASSSTGRRGICPACDPATRSPPRSPSATSPSPACGSSPVPTSPPSRGPRRSEVRRRLAACSVPIRWYTLSS